METGIDLVYPHATPVSVCREATWTLGKRNLISALRDLMWNKHRHFALQKISIGERKRGWNEKAVRPSLTFRNTPLLVVSLIHLSIYFYFSLFSNGCDRACVWGCVLPCVCMRVNIVIALCAQTKLCKIELVCFLSSLIIALNWKRVCMYIEVHIYVYEVYIRGVKKVLPILCTVLLTFSSLRRTSRPALDPREAITIDLIMSRGKTLKAFQALGACCLVQAQCSHLPPHAHLTSIIGSISSQGPPSHCTHVPSCSRFAL